MGPPPKEVMGGCSPPPRQATGGAGEEGPIFLPGLFCTQVKLLLLLLSQGVGYPQTQRAPSSSPALFFSGRAEPEEGKHRAAGFKEGEL